MIDEVFQICGRSLVIRPEKPTNQTGVSRRRKPLQLLFSQVYIYTWGNRATAHQWTFLLNFGWKLLQQDGSCADDEQPQRFSSFEQYRHPQKSCKLWVFFFKISYALPYMALKICEIMAEDYLSNQSWQLKIQLLFLCNSACSWTSCIFKVKVSRVRVFISSGEKQWSRSR